MMQYTTVQALGQARLAELHRQAQRDALSRTGKARNTSRRHLAHRRLRLLDALTRRGRLARG